MLMLTYGVLELITLCIVYVGFRSMQWLLTEWRWQYMYFCCLVLPRYPRFEFRVYDIFACICLIYYEI